MTEFFEAVRDLPFLRWAFVAGLVGAIPCGIAGTWVVTSRLSYLVAALAHAVLLGVGAVLALNAAYGWSLAPMHGALVTALLMAVVLEWIEERGRERSDTLISALWCLGLAGGLLLIAASDSRADPMSYLFGDILLITFEELAYLIGYTLFLLLAYLPHRHALAAIAFDPEHARLRGLPVRRYRLIALLALAAGVVLLMSLVGLMLVLALLVLPAALAGRFCRGLGKMVLLACLLAAAFNTLGLLLSYHLDWPTGPTIVLLASVAYLLALLKR